jgi:hypothetical protein
MLHKHARGRGRKKGFKMARTVMSRDEVAEELGISVLEVSKLERSALGKLRNSAALWTWWYEHNAEREVNPDYHYLEPEHKQKQQRRWNHD